MWTGLMFALGAGLMWGLVFVAPLLMADYPPALLVAGRYLAFGLIALPLALADRRSLKGLAGSDWLEACKLSAIGNFLYYLCLAGAIQRAGAALPTVIIGTLPVVIAISSNLRDHRRDGRLPWLQLSPALALIAAGIACVNHAELQRLTAQLDAGTEALRAYGEGAVLAVLAVACWTWYPIRNADWLRAHQERSPRVWATAQGLVTLPMALLCFALLMGLPATDWGLLPAGFELPLGPRPAAYLALMAAIGLFSSWIGTLCWNEASQRLPTSLVGQLIVFETLAALAYAFALAGRWPSGWTAGGIALLIAGVILALRIKPQASTA
ncbi:EamA family transporter [Paucibacter aquatile]|uniref:EamA family transporter n=1 Tax=Kinneretia aquatilis TaxID=2070761 RepID=A0A2N8L0U0_9BURK|nr:DMT family transporter [Paucibacter aquatile]PND39330.1 EamA family transporter [Paucibacter aquatile]WIV98427.1 DMT family transporter [Paucibacter aquatile]